MDKSLEADRSAASDVFPPPRFDGDRRELLGASTTLSARLISRAAQSGPRPSCRAVVASAPPFQLAQSRPVQHYLVAAACGLAWSVFWMLLISAIVSPFPSGEMEEQPAAAYESSRPGYCPSGMIDLSDRCVLGEELEVRPPRSWTRR
jgi:hypothetical protein